jgi:SAM-dependent methyltransferase
MANEKKVNGDAYPIFKNMDMRFINEHYQPESFNTVVCFGNTLAHLLSVEDIKTFLKASYDVLLKGGHLLIQILNYRNILDNKIDRLPMIDNEYVRFERYYEYNHPDYIDFKTILTVKKDNEVVHNTIQLFPVKRELIEQLLDETGFNNIEFYGNFKMEPLTDNSMPLVIKAVK